VISSWKGSASATRLAFASGFANSAVNSGTIAHNAVTAVRRLAAATCGCMRQSDGVGGIVNRTGSLLAFFG
jgi:hypothetical protein